MVNKVRRTFEGIILNQSAKAILFQCHFWWAPMWVPRSQIEITDDFDSDEKVIYMSAWLADKNDLEEFREYTEEEMAVKNERP